MRDYTVNPYAGYDHTDEIGVDGTCDDDRLHPKTEVVGVTHGDVARAYPTPALEREDVVHDEVGGLPVVVASTADGTPVAYVREVGGEVVRFPAADERHLRAAGTRWRRSTGVAVDGPYQGERLARANEVSPLFWFAWLEFHPDSELYR
jgi:hypothetical protein